MKLYPELYEIFDILKKGLPEYKDKIYLVGGCVRDLILGIDNHDFDFCVEGDAVALMNELADKGLCRDMCSYNRFNTASCSVNGIKCEFTGCRKESYCADTRKPLVCDGTIYDDAMRRDFTFNTLMINIYDPDSEIIDLTGRGIKDLENKFLDTPDDPLITFDEDPLRIVRAVRFAGRLGFSVSDRVKEAGRKKMHRLEIVSHERIREEFVKILCNENAADGLNLLNEWGLLEYLFPDLHRLVGMSQNKYHIYDVWEHTLKVLENTDKYFYECEGWDRDYLKYILRISALFHDIGKGETKSCDEDGNVHFLKHEIIGTDITRSVLNRYRFANDEITDICSLVRWHMRIGTYSVNWSKGAVRRLIKDCGKYLNPLFILTKADIDASNPEYHTLDNMDNLKERIKNEPLEFLVSPNVSPLNGNEIMNILGQRRGKTIGEAKKYLEDLVIEEKLDRDDKVQAEILIKEKFSKISNHQNFDEF